MYNLLQEQLGLALALKSMNVCLTHVRIMQHAKILSMAIGVVVYRDIPAPTARQI